MILLINPKTTKPSEFQTDFFREPNLGILYLAAILDQNEIPVDILDLEQYYNLTEQERREIIEQKTSNYNIIGITSLTNTYYLALEIAEIIKKYDNNIFIVLGGPHVSFQYNEILTTNKTIDFVCIGEAENSFPQLIKILLKKIGNNNNIHDYDLQLKLIKGIAYTNSNGDLIFTGYPEPIDIEKIPLPARYKLSQDNFYYRVANVIINRGCPYQCSFCSRQKLFKQTRIRSINSIYSEIRDIISLQIYNYLNFYDNININREFFKGFCEMFIQNNIKLPWGCELRVDTLIEEETRLLKEAGCKLIATGIESASLDVLQKNFKYQDPKKVKNGVKLLKKYNIPIQAYFVLGLPGETENTFKETIAFIKELQFDEYDRINYFMATPYPGSRLWDDREYFNIKILEKDFSKYDCQHIIFETKDLTMNKLKRLYNIAKEIETFYIKN